MIYFLVLQEASCTPGSSCTDFTYFMIMIIHVLIFLIPSDFQVRETGPLPRRFGREGVLLDEIYPLS